MFDSQMRALQVDERFLSQCADHYSRGYKDWHIIGAISNLMMNMEARRRGIEMHPKNETRVCAVTEELKSVVFPVDFFLGQKLEFYYTLHLFTCMKQWGFESRGLGYDAKAVEKFMRERMKHFDIDIEHAPMFGRPPAWWPRLPPLAEVLSKIEN
jgi:hypothetical protein